MEAAAGLTILFLYLLGKVYDWAKVAWFTVFLCVAIYGAVTYDWSTL
jgi:hypothetical protein